MHWHTVRPNATNLWTQDFSIGEKVDVYVFREKTNPMDAAGKVRNWPIRLQRFRHWKRFIAKGAASRLRAHPLGISDFLPFDTEKMLFITRQEKICRKRFETSRKNPWEWTDLFEISSRTVSYVVASILSEFFFARRETTDGDETNIHDRFAAGTPLVLTISEFWDQHGKNYILF